MIQWVDVWCEIILFPKVESTFFSQWLILWVEVGQALIIHGLLDNVSLVDDLSHVTTVI